MSSTFSKTLMVLLLCLTFVGQAMAATVMSYHMMSMKGMNSQAQSQAQSHAMSMMDHSGHHMMNNASADEAGNAESMKDCCAQSCNCFTSGCSSFVALIKNLSPNPIIDYCSKINSISNLAPSQQFTSLYRPPILS